ncbi:unnamed protein product, partial [Symbiodinium sp. KB8]
EDYFDAASNTWDIEGLEADLRLAKGSAIEKLEASAIKVNGRNGRNGASKSNGEKSGAQLFDELRSVDSSIAKEDYYDASTNTWDVQGMQEDLLLMGQQEKQDSMRTSASPVRSIPCSHHSWQPTTWRMPVRCAVAVRNVPTQREIFRAANASCRPLTQKLFCERPDGFCDRLSDALRRKFGAPRFLRLRERARLLQLPPSELKRELRNRGADVAGLVEKGDLVEAILESREGTPTKSLPTQPTSTASHPVGGALTRGEVQSLPLAEIQKRLKALSVPYGHCLERRELEDLLLSQGAAGRGGARVWSPQGDAGAGDISRQRCFQCCRVH